MICPQCGYDMGSKNKCLRCGYEAKTLIPVDEKAEEEKKDKEETKVIDPSKVYITDEYGNDVNGTPDPFDMLFGNLFDPIGDILGGLFGIDIGSPFGSSHTYYRETRSSDAGASPIKKKKQGKIVEVDDVEICDENGNPIKPEKDKKAKNPKMHKNIHGKKKRD